ncbi:unnamed protein product, partial [Ixodes hexagonus]
QLEADILRLTTRLMMRERDLRHAKQQLKLECSRSNQSVLSWKSRAKQRDDQLRALLQEKDHEMNLIVSQLVLLEAQLCKEQLRIEKLLVEKDAIIKFQRHELFKFKKDRVRKDKQFEAAEDSTDEIMDLPPPPQLETATVATQTTDHGWYCVCEDRTLLQQQPKSLVAIQKLRNDLAKSRSAKDSAVLLNNGSAAKRSNKASKQQPAQGQQRPSVIINMVGKSPSPTERSNKQERTKRAEDDTASHSKDRDFELDKNVLRIEDIAMLRDRLSKRKALYIQRPQEGASGAQQYHQVR